MWVRCVWLPDDVAIDVEPCMLIAYDDQRRAIVMTRSRAWNSRPFLLWTSNAHDDDDDDGNDDDIGDE